MDRFRILPNGKIEALPGTPGEEKDFQLFYAGVLEREAAAREARSPEWAADLRAWAAKARMKAAAIDTSPAQADLFGGSDDR